MCDAGDEKIDIGSVEMSLKALRPTTDLGSADMDIIEEAIQVNDDVAFDQLTKFISDNKTILHSDEQDVNNSMFIRKLLLKSLENATEDDSKPKRAFVAKAEEFVSSVRGNPYSFKKETVQLLDLHDVDPKYRSKAFGVLSDIDSITKFFESLSDESRQSRESLLQRESNNLIKEALKNDGVSSGVSLSLEDIKEDGSRAQVKRTIKAKEKFLKNQIEIEDKTLESLTALMYTGDSESLKKVDELMCEKDIYYLGDSGEMPGYIKYFRRHFLHIAKTQEIESESPSVVDMRRASMHYFEAIFGGSTEFSNESVMEALDTFDVVLRVNPSKAKKFISDLLEKQSSIMHGSEESSFLQQEYIKMKLLDEVKDFSLKEAEIDMDLENKGENLISSVMKFPELYSKEVVSRAAFINFIKRVKSIDVDTKSVVEESFLQIGLDSINGGSSYNETILALISESMKDTLDLTKVSELMPMNSLVLESVLLLNMLPKDEIPNNVFDLATKLINVNLKEYNDKFESEQEMMFKVLNHRVARGDMRSIKFVLENFSDIQFSNSYEDKKDRFKIQFQKIAISNIEALKDADQSVDEVRNLIKAIKEDPSRFARDLVELVKNIEDVSI